MLASEIINFLFNLHLPFTPPAGVEVLDAYKQPEIREACREFYERYYSDNSPRHLLLGINPGRFGGGVTGIPFTDPIRLQNACGIHNNFQKKQELSSVFMYNMIDALGGPQAFYSRFYISATSPLGFIKLGKNLNYYDDKALMQLIEPFVVKCLQQQLAFGLHTNVCFCIGEGENLKYLQKLNARFGWFEKIESLPHPRFIMQYRLKSKEAFIQLYVEKLNAAHLSIKKGTGAA